MSIDNKKEQEREELHRAIWAIADELRGAVDGWDFKNYVLGTMFYRYISENISEYINKGERDAGDLEFDYAKLEDEQAETIRSNCGNIIYLITTELAALEEISKLCGDQNSKSALITKEELKTLKLFEAIILKTRVMPIKTKLKPDYLINWNIDFSENKDYPQTILKEKNVYTYE